MIGSSQSPYEYEDRLVLYADILGWQEAIKTTNEADLIEALHRIHQRAEIYNERERQRLLAQDGKVVDTPLGSRKVHVNHAVLKIQFGAFSDHFIYSVPAWFGGRIFDIAQSMLQNLLQLGFLTRGAIVRGKLFHRDNMVFGPALVAAVLLEENEAIYPRILIEDAALATCKEQGHLDDSEHQYVIEDQSGRRVVNPFVLPMKAPRNVLKNFVELNFRFHVIRPMIQDRIEALKTEGRYKHAEKWTYLKNLIEGPVLDATPSLKEFWESA